MERHDEGGGVVWEVVCGPCVKRISRNNQRGVHSGRGAALPALLRGEDPEFANYIKKLAASGRVSRILCKRDSLMLRHPVTELDSKTVQRSFPVPYRHRPFFADILLGQVEQF